MPHVIRTLTARLSDLQQLKKTMSKDDQMIGIQMYFINCTKTLSVHSLKHVHMIEKKETTHQEPQRITLAAH